MGTLLHRVIRRLEDVLGGYDSGRAARYPVNWEKRCWKGELRSGFLKRAFVKEKSPSSVGHTWGKHKHQKGRKGSPALFSKKTKQPRSKKECITRTKHSHIGE